MDAKDVSHEPTWDRERLGDLAKGLEEYGGELSVSVVQDISQLASNCVPVASVLIYLHGRKVISKDDYEKLKKEPVGTNFTHALVASSYRSMGEGKHLIKNLYLALLDAFLDTCDRGCHHLALCLRQTAVQHLQRHLTRKGAPQIPTEEMTDIQSAIARLPDVNLQSPAAFKLRDQLDLPHGTEVTSLKAILEEYNKSKVNVGPNPDAWLVPVVQAMMLTQGVGRYVTKLLPFHLSYPAEILIFLDKLGEKWEGFAHFLGFTNDEIGDLKYHSFGKTNQEIKNFSKVWRMPDMKRKNDDILHRVLVAANINLGVPAVESSPAATSLHQIAHQGSPMVIKVITQCSHQSSPGLSQRSSLERNSYGSDHYRPYMREIGSAQSGSSDLGGSFESDVPHHTISRQSYTNDVDTDNMSNVPYVRESSFLEEEDDSAIASSYPSPTKPALTSQHPLAPKPFPGALGLDSTTSRPTSLEVCPISQPTTAHSGEMVAPLLTSPQKQPLASDQPTIDSALPQFHPDDEVTVKSNSIGGGLYGEVWEVEHKGGRFAAKDYRSGLSEELKEMFMQKMLSLKHKNVVRYFGVCRMKDTNCSVVVMEKFPHSLKSLCQGQGGEKKELQPETKLLILRQVANGLAYLHSHDIIHGDLVPTNILMLTVPEYMAKIADCGNSLVERISTACTKCRLDKSSFLLDYLSPETVAGDISKESDVFSFGHLTLYVVLQHEPHPLLKSIEKRKSITRSEVERRKKYFDEMCINVRGNVLEPLVEWTELCLSDCASVRPKIAQFRGN